MKKIRNLSFWWICRSNLIQLEATQSTNNLLLANFKNQVPLSLKTHKTRMTLSNTAKVYIVVVVSAIKVTANLILKARIRN